jgi:hypothetical protein
MSKVGAKKSVLIITDGTELIEVIAKSIKKTLTGLTCDDSTDTNNKLNIKICSAENFNGTDLLPSEIFFIGCNEPNPPSFSYLEDMLNHINLASRKCGIFSGNKKAIKYLDSIVKDCEAVCSEFLTTPDTPDTNTTEWLKTILS